MSMKNTQKRWRFVLFWAFIFTLLPIGGGIISNLYFGRNFEPTILLIGFPVSYLLGILIALLYWERQKKHKNSSPRVSD